jgi:hypothetical protein
MAWDRDSFQTVRRSDGGVPNERTAAETERCYSCGGDGYREALGGEPGYDPCYTCQTTGSVPKGEWDRIQREETYDPYQGDEPPPQYGGGREMTKQEMARYEELIEAYDMMEMGEGPDLTPEEQQEHSQLEEIARGAGLRPIGPYGDRLYRVDGYGTPYHGKRKVAKKCPQCGMTVYDQNTHNAVAHPDHGATGPSAMPAGGGLQGNEEAGPAKPAKPAKPKGIDLSSPMMFGGSKTAGSHPLDSHIEPVLEAWQDDFPNDYRPGEDPVRDALRELALAYYGGPEEVGPQGLLPPPRASKEAAGRWRPPGEEPIGIGEEECPECSNTVADGEHARGCSRNDKAGCGSHGDFYAAGCEACEYVNEDEDDDDDLEEDDGLLWEQESEYRRMT